MGCFGDMEPTKQTESTQTSSPPAWVEQAGQSNYDLARSVLDAGFKPYTGEQVAPLSGNEQAASRLVGDAAATGNPYAGTTEADIRGYGAAPAFNYDFSKVTDENGPLGSINSYMDPYLRAVLDPVLRQIGISGSQQRQGINANATSAGAFGDARHGVAESEQRKNQMLQEGDATAQGYSGAFNSAMGLRMQDLQRLFGTQQAQNTANETSLNRMRQSGIDLTGLDQYGVSRALGLSDALDKTGGIERGVNQAKDTADYGEFMRGNKFTNDEIAFLTSILAGTPTSKTTSGTSTTSEPNNSGYQMIGSVLGAIL